MLKELISPTAHKEYMIYAKEKKCKICMLIAFIQFFHVLSSLKLQVDLLNTNRIKFHKSTQGKQIKWLKFEQKFCPKLTPVIHSSEIDSQPLFKNIYLHDTSK
jgi:hypothetical protein